MTNTQTTLPFCIRKNLQTNFYPGKNDSDDVSKVTYHVQEKQNNSSVYIPRVKKIMELSSDDENIDFLNTQTVKKQLKRKYASRNYEVSAESSSETECSPRKICRKPHFKKSQIKYQSKPCNNVCSDDAKDNSNDSAVNIEKTLLGRESELQKITIFLDNHLKYEKSGSLYISGSPGTGKTACLLNMLERPKYKEAFTEVYINCTSMKSAGSIYNRICQELHIKSSSSTEKASLMAIDKYLNKKHNMILLVLDEIDQLVNKKQSVLYTIFEWPLRSMSKIVLVGIANALDLTDRVLPRLRSRCDLELELMHFRPYTKQQIIDIFSAKLKEEMTTDLFSPAAIQMLASKVAAISGDIRRALDIGKRVIDLASTKSNHKTVELSQVITVLNDVYGSSQKFKTDVDDNFPIQQKILICTLLLLLNKGNNKIVTLGKLHDVFKRVCIKRSMVPVDSTEFVGLCGLVETRGMIKLSGKKEPRMYKITLQWDESEVTSAISDKELISDILNDIDCLK